MTFQAFETSDGQPVELLTMVNGVTIERYTNAENQLVIGANTFEPLEYRRTAPAQSKDADDAQVRITLPADNPIVRLYSTILTSNITTITIERFHNNDPDEQVQVFWKGQIGSVTVSDAEATILCIPLTQGRDELPRYTYQALCNYFLYDTNSCRVVRDDFRFVGTITSFLTPTQVTCSGLRARAQVIDTGQGGNLTSDELDEYWLNGYLETGGEVRRIVRSPGGGSPADPDTVDIPFPFQGNVQVGDPIEVFAGCRRDTDICNRKFNNLLNYGGWPTVPKRNPFTIELPPGSREDTGGGFFG